MGSTTVRESERATVHLMQMAFVLLIGAVLSGCSSREKFDVAPVKGKVLCDGRPVPGGIVTFAPVASGNSLKPGKSAGAEIETDGTFVLSTYAQGDGAVIGKCKVTTGSSDPENPWACTLGTPIDWEVQAGNNEVVIELLPDGTGRIASAGG
jgi:hypothetical protein